MDLELAVKAVDAVEVTNAFVKYLSDGNLNQSVSYEKVKQLITKCSACISTLIAEHSKVSIKSESSNG